MPGTTSLLRSAASTRKKIQQRQDAEVAFQYANSTKTYDQFLQYSQYLNDRANSTTDPSERLSIAKTIKSAQSGYISNEIQRNTQAVMEGRASLEEKQATIAKLWQSAVDIGNYDQALSLQSNWDNLSVQIQNRNDAAQQAQIALGNAQEAYNKKLATATGGAYADLASSLEGGLNELSRAYAEGGQVAYNKAAKDFVDSHRDVLKELGVEIPKDYATGVGQLMQGMVNGIANYYALAAQATEADNPDASQRYKEKLQAIANGEKTFKSPTGGQLNAAQIAQFAQTPNKYLEYVNPQTGLTELKPSTVKSYRIDENGKLVRDYSGLLKAPKPKEDKNYVKQLEALGFTGIEYDDNSGTYKVQLNPKTDKWLDPAKIGRTGGATIPLVPTASGFQFVGSDNTLYNFARDKKGLGALYKVDPTGGLQHLTGQYGFNQSENTATANLGSLIQAKKWVAPLQTPQQAIASVPGSAPVVKALSAPTYQPGIEQQVFSMLNNSRQKQGPQMVQRPGGGFNYVDATGKPISAYTYAQQTGQSFRSVLSNAASRGDTFSAQALKYAGNDGAYNPAQVDAGTAKNWTSLTWGNNVPLQTPQVSRVGGVPQLSFKPYKAY